MGKHYSGIDLIELVVIHVSVDNELLKYYFSYLLCILSFLSLINYNTSAEVIF